MQERMAKCVFENPDEKIFCPIAQDEFSADLEACNTCIEINSSTPGDLSMNGFLRLHPDLDKKAVGKLLSNRKRIATKDFISLGNPKNFPIDQTPLRSIHKRLTELPTVWREIVLEKVR